MTKTSNTGKPILHPFTDRGIGQTRTGIRADDHTVPEHIRQKQQARYGKA